MLVHVRAYTTEDCSSEYPLQQLIVSKCSDSLLTTGGIDCKTLQQYLHTHTNITYMHT